MVGEGSVSLCQQRALAQLFALGVNRHSVNLKLKLCQDAVNLSAVGQLTVILYR